MTGGSVAYSPFPDDSSQTLHRVISRLSEEDRRDMTWQPSTGWLVEVSAIGSRRTKCQALIRMPRQPWLRWWSWNGCEPSGAAK